MSDDVMRRFPVPDTDDLPEDIERRIAEETERAGFTPNVFEAFAYKPSHFRAFFAFHDALVDDTPLARAFVLAHGGLDQDPAPAVGLNARFREQGEVAVDEAC